MFRLPVCPHCGTVYHYKDTKAAIKNRENTCYHCEKKFVAKRFPYLIIGALIPLVLCIVLNIVLLSRMESLQLWPLILVTLVFLLIIYLIIPFFTKFKIMNKKDEGKKK